MGRKTLSAVVAREPAQVHPDLSLQRRQVRPGRPHSSQANPALRGDTRKSFGADGGDRTLDLNVGNIARYQLRYACKLQVMLPTSKGRIPAASC